MIKHTVAIIFSARWIVFFVLLETLTVPMVAMSNVFVAQNLLYLCIMGFLVAFIVVLFLVKVLKKLIIKHSHNLLGIVFDNVSGLWYIGILAGILEMVMFFVQDILFIRHWDDFRVGFMSAFISVAVTLLIYELVALFSNFSIKFYRQGQIFQLRFAGRDILLLALIFGGYEFLACPITGLWIPFHQHRLLVAILSGILGGGCGGVFLYCLSRFTPLEARLTIQAG